MAAIADLVVQKASIRHESVATAPAVGYGQWLSWREKPAA